MNKMLISATHADEVRIALVKGQKLYDLDIEQAGLEQKKANIYKGRIARVEPSLEAAFVDYGANKHGFLPFKEVARSYLKPEHANESFANLGIRDIFTEGKEVLVQIDKEERGNKGAALTTFISLAGSYLVLMPNDPRVGGISRRVEGKERDELRDLLQSLNVPEGMGLIVRTAGVGKSHQELKWDLDSLLARWQAIGEVLPNTQTPALIYQEGDAVMRAIRDYLRQDIVEILVDNKELFEKTKLYVEQAKPDFANKVKLYDSDTPLFSFYQIENQIETAYQRVVKLPSGGSISIDHTEALISIDVNSAKATGGGDIEETAFNTNLEAAEEIARQLRIRDIGGLVVIDFIDMSKVKHQQDVSHKLREALEHDRARVQVGHITRFGLLEMSRQRLGSHLGSTVQVSCPRCDGQGTIRSIESLASSIVRLIEEDALKKDTAEIHVQLPIDLATFVLNEKREVISEISKRLKVEIIVLPNQYLQTPKYKIKRLKAHEAIKNRGSSYEVVTAPEPVLTEKSEVAKVTPEKPAVPINLEHTISLANKGSIFFKVKCFFAKLFSKKTTKEDTKKTSDLAKRLSGPRNFSKNRPRYSNPKKYRRTDGYGTNKNRRVTSSRPKSYRSNPNDKTTTKVENSMPPAQTITNQTNPQESSDRPAFDHNSKAPGDNN